MKRRKVLFGCSTVLAGLLAGCGSGSSDSADTTPTDTPEGTPTPQEVSLGTAVPGENTPTPSPTPEPTATPEPTPEPTPTATPTPTAPTHEVGERFTVGSGSNAITYRITGFSRADELGSVMNPATADGTFLVVTLDLTNPQDDQITFPRDSFRAKSSSLWHAADRDATEAIGSDDRIDAEPFLNRTVPSGETRSGAVALDVNPNRSYRVWILPVGRSGEEHFVPVGDISSVQPL